MRKWRWKEEIVVGVSIWISLELSHNLHERAKFVLWVILQSKYDYPPNVNPCFVMDRNINRELTVCKRVRMRGS